jgi:hypothetical protein
MKIPPQKTEKQKEEFVYKYCYKKWIQIGTLKEQQSENSNNRK